VLVDGVYEAAPPPADGQPAPKPKYTARSEEEMRKISDIVKKAMGYSQERGDEVQVENVAFGFEGEEGPGATAQAENKLTAWAPYIRYGVGAVMFLLVLLFVVRPLVGMLTSPPAVTASAEAIGGPSLASQDALALGGGGLQALPGIAPTAIADMARSNPQSAAMVLKKWMKPTA
jgi:flagellar M-ring protein FliF